MSGRDRFLLAAARGYVGLLDRTVRIDVTYGERLEETEARSGGFIYAFWHCRLLLAALVHDGVPTVTMISRHGDGGLIAGVVESRGIRAVRGSTTRGGSEALREMIAMARAGTRRFAVTPDGPRGPARKVQPGIVLLAAATGYPIIPSGLSATPSTRVSSWDRFVLPWAFARVRVVYGEPIVVPRDGDEVTRAAIARTLETTLDTLDATAAGGAG